MPSPGAMANRRLLLYLLAAAFLLSVFILSISRHSTTPILPSRLSSSSSSTSTPPYTYPNSNPNPATSPSKPSSSSSAAEDSDAPLAYAKSPIHHVDVDKSTLQGGAIMPKLGNETLKAELGRAAWKVFHTTMARFPDKPTEDERTALFSYIHLFARLYPCGECASHFRSILQSFPPQVATRSVAAVWACHVHNEVNKSLQKPEFDCSKIGDFYDCGCADEEKKEMKMEGEKKNKAEEAEGGKGKAHTKQPDLKVEREREQLGG